MQVTSTQAHLVPRVHEALAPERAICVSPARERWVAINRWNESRRDATLAAAVSLALLLLPACSINVKKDQNGQDKQVDIKTIVGGIHVSKQADPADTGLAVYPGAHLKPNESNGEDKSANVNISGFGFGVKVVALEYQSDATPEKLITFYKDELKKYGSVLVCHTSGHFNVNMDRKHDDHDSNELTCDSSNGKNVELKVGTKDNQHIVAIEPEGKGSSFALVYVRTHGKDADI